MLETWFFYRISLAFRWNYSFLMKVSIYWWKTLTKSTNLKYLVLKVYFLMGPLFHHFSQIKWNQEQKWIVPSESQWNSVEKPCLWHSFSEVYLCLLNLLRNWEGKVQFFNVFSLYCSFLPISILFSMEILQTLNWKTIYKPQKRPVSVKRWTKHKDQVTFKTLCTSWILSDTYL